jgi:hypothetical protein
MATSGVLCVVGLTATPHRRDDAITEMQLGPIRFRVDSKSQAENRPFNHTLIVRETEFHLPYDDPRAFPVLPILRFPEKKLKLLHIDSSISDAQSVSRPLSARVVTRL